MRRSTRRRRAAGGRGRGREHRPDRGRDALAPPRVPARGDVGLLAERAAGLPGFARAARGRGRRWAADLFDAAVASGFRWPRSRSASSAARCRTWTRRRSARRCSATATSRAQRRRDRRRQHLLRDPRGGAQVAPGSGPRRADASPRLRDRLRREPRRDAFAGLPAERGRRRAAERGDAGLRRRRRRRDRLRPGGRAARPRARLRQGAGRLQLLVQLLRRSRSSAALRAAARAAAVLAEVRRRVAQGHREVVLTGINLGCFRDREAGLHAAAARSRGRGDARAAAAAPLLDRGQPRDEELVRALRETPTVSRHLHVPLQSGDDRVLRAMGRRYTAATYLRRLAPLADFNLTTRRDRRLPGRGRARVRAHAETLSRGRDHEGARLSVLAATGHARRPPGHRPAGREEGAQALGCARLATTPACAGGARSSAARTSCWSTGRAGATATTTRRGSSTDAPVGELVRVRAAAVTRGRDRRCLR